MNKRVGRPYLKFVFEPSIVDRQRRLDMSELTITSSQIQGDIAVTILHLSGHLHGATEQVLLDRAKEAHEDGARYLLIDLTDLAVLSSAGLRAIHGVFNVFTPPSDVAVI